MKSLFPHTEHNAIKRILSLVLLLSLEFSTFAHAGMLAIMPIEKQWLTNTQNTSILDFFLSKNNVPAPITPNFVPQKVIYNTPKIVVKSIIPIKKVVSNIVPNDGWLNTVNIFSNNINNPTT